MKTSDNHPVDQNTPRRDDSETALDVEGYRAPSSEVIKLTDAIGIESGSGWIRTAQ